MKHLDKSRLLFWLRCCSNVGCILIQIQYGAQPVPPKFISRLAAQHDHCLPALERP
jgi:hypothetical protein